jgi:hypothetical protein
MQNSFLSIYNTFLSGVMWSPRLRLIMLRRVMPVKIIALINGFEGNLRRLKNPHLHFAMSTFFLHWTITATYSSCRIDRFPDARGLKTPTNGKLYFIRSYRKYKTKNRYEIVIADKNM